MGARGHIGDVELFKYPSAISHNAAKGPGTSRAQTVTPVRNSTSSDICHYRQRQPLLWKNKGERTFLLGVSNGLLVYSQTYVDSSRIVPAQLSVTFCGIACELGLHLPKTCRGPVWSE